MLWLCGMRCNHSATKMPICLLMSYFVSYSKESQVHQRISELRKEGQWSASRLPKLVEASRPKTHWDYLLEEMQWMAADFAQERRWKEAAAKKVWQRLNYSQRWHSTSALQNPLHKLMCRVSPLQLVRTCARYHQEQKKSEERSKKEKEIHLRYIASTIAREVEFFWSNIEQVCLFIYIFF